MERQYKTLLGAILTTLLLFGTYLSDQNDDDYYDYYDNYDEHVRSLTIDPKSIAVKPQGSILSTLEWPPAEMTNIPEGIYVSSSTSPSLSTNTTGDYGRVLLYVTTHMSQQHEIFLKYCWPNILARSALLRGADVAVYLNPQEEKRKEAMDLLENTFAGQNLKVYLRSNGAPVDEPNQEFTRDVMTKEKTSGANMAMYEAVTSDFFDGYDWVVRLNPDVIVRDDSFLVQSMATPSVSAVLINCSKRGTKVHTDFFAIRPIMLNANAFPLTDGNAEKSFTASINESVLVKGFHRWIPAARPKWSRCRAGDGKDFFQSPIVHEHIPHPDMCSVPSEIDVSAVFPDPWPLKWNAV